MSNLKKYLVSAVVLGSSVSAFAQDPQKVQIDVSSMLSQVDFSTVIAGIVAAGGVLIGPRIAKMGIRFILGLFGR
jgi:hypothetical protein